MRRGVLIVIGAGGMGQGIARRLGPGKTVLLADVDEDTLRSAAALLSGDGHDVRTQRVDVSSRQSVDDLVGAARALGEVVQLAHTAGLSPAQASAAAILAVDLLGVAVVLEAFAPVVGPGAAGLVIASMAGHLVPPLTAEQEWQLATSPADDLLRLPFASPEGMTDPGAAYGLAKRANILRVRAASVPWGERGARINSLSPGIISTAMGHQELASEVGPVMRAMISASPAGRLGTPDDVIAAAAFLLGDESLFVTGTDLLVDGGVVAAVRAGRLTPSA